MTSKCKGLSVAQKMAATLHKGEHNIDEIDVTTRGGKLLQKHMPVDLVNIILMYYMKPKSDYYHEGDKRLNMMCDRCFYVHMDLPGPIRFVFAQVLPNCESQPIPTKCMAFTHEESLVPGKSSESLKFGTIIGDSQLIQMHHKRNDVDITEKHIERFIWCPTERATAINTKMVPFDRRGRQWC